MSKNWNELVGQRLLLTDWHTRIERNEWTLLEIAPSGRTGKFRNELNGWKFWCDFEKLSLLDVLPELFCSPQVIACEQHCVWHPLQP